MRLNPNKARMKKLLLTAAFFFAGFTLVHAQSFGIKGGVNFSNFRGDDADNFNVLTGFHAGLITEFSVFDFLSIQPEFLYSTQGAKTKDSDYKLDYLTLPVLAKIYITDGFNVHAGPQFGLLISESDNFSGYKSNTFDFSLAAGVEYFFSDHLALQARYVSGTSTISEKAKIKNSNIQLSLAYMF